MRARAIIAALLGLSVTSGCLNGSDSPMSDNMENPEVVLTDEGWSRFEAGATRQALDKFNEAIVVADAYSDAHHGAGWALAFLDSIGPAFTAFTNAIDRAHPGAEAFAGRAFVRVEPPLGDLQGGVDDAAEALSLEPGFVFDHDASIDWRDLRLLRAQAFFVLGEMDSAVLEVESLGGTAPPSESLAFADSLLAEIERLGVELDPPAL